MNTHKERATIFGHPGPTETANQRANHLPMQPPRRTGPLPIENWLRANKIQQHILHPGAKYFRPGRKHISAAGGNIFLAARGLDRNIVPYVFNCVSSGLELSRKHHNILNIFRRRWPGRVKHMPAGGEKIRERGANKNMAPPGEKIRPSLLGGGISAPGEKHAPRRRTNRRREARCA